MYLNVHSYFSLKYGTLSPEKLVMAAKQKGVKALVLTDINNTSCAYEFITCCKKYGIKPILGIEFRKENRLLYIGIAKNEQGFFELNHFLTEHSLEEKPLPELAPEMQHVYFIYEKLVKPIAAFQNHEFLGVRPKEVNRLFKSSLLKYQNRLVIFSPVTFLDHEGFRTHKLLRAIDLNIVITKLEKEDYAEPEETFYEEAILLKNYENYPQLIENTRRIIDDCSIDLESTFSNNRQTFTGGKKVILSCYPN